MTLSRSLPNSHLEASRGNRIRLAFVNQEVAGDLKYRSETPPGSRWGASGARVRVRRAGPGAQRPEMEQRNRLVKWDGVGAGGPRAELVPGGDRVPEGRPSAGAPRR